MSHDKSKYTQINLAKKGKKVVVEQAAAADKVTPPAKSKAKAKSQAQAKRKKAKAEAASADDAKTEDGAAFFDAFDPFVEGLDLPRGVVFLGLDLSPALGGDEVRSGTLAAAFRAALLLVNELP